MSKAKNVRLITDNYQDGKSKEYLEVDPTGIIWWRAVDESLSPPAEAGFPVDLYFASDFFLERGRNLDIGKLPPHTQRFPYGRYRDVLAA